MALIIPIIVILFSFLLKLASGPYWQFPDPSYGNLSSSLSLIKGLSPSFNNQPGTPVQILGAIVIFLLNIGHSASDIVKRVLLDPDFYLNAINITMIVFVFVTSFFLGAYIYRQTNDKLATLLSQLPVLYFLSLRSYSFYDYVLPVVTNVSPEPLLISISSLFNLYLLKLFFAKEKNEETSIVLCLGFICGLGVTTRLIFLPFLLLPFIVSRWPMKFLFITVSAVSCFFWTIPIIPYYGWLLDWIFKVSTHMGEYGSGGAGFVNFTQYIVAWHSILNRCGLLILFALVALVYSLNRVIKTRSCSREAKFLLATAFCIFLQFSLIGKHYDDHYLVSVINLFSPLFVLFYLSIKNKGLFFKTGISIYIIIFTLLSLGHALAYNRQLSGYTIEALRFNKMIHAQYPDFNFIGVYPMPFSNPESSFFWGNDRDCQQQDEFSKLFPKNLAYYSNNVNNYAPYVSGIYSIKQRVWADDLITSGSHVMFVAPKGYDFSQTPYTVLPLDQGKYAATFLLAGSTEKQANDFFEAAVKLSAAGDYPHAFVFALKSKELHYQPVEKVEFLLTLIYQRIKH